MEISFRRHPTYFLWFDGGCRCSLYSCYCGLHVVGAAGEGNAETRLSHFLEFSTRFPYNFTLFLPFLQLVSPFFVSATFSLICFSSFLSFETSFSYLCPCLHAMFPPFLWRLLPLFPHYLVSLPFFPSLLLDSPF